MMTPEEAGALVDAQIRDAVQAERDRIYGLFLSTPWQTDPFGEDTEGTRAVKADRFMLMILVRDGVQSYQDHPKRDMFVSAADPS